MSYRRDLETDPKTTGNNLRDVVDWLGLGDYIVMYDDSGRERKWCPCCSSGRGIAKIEDVPAQLEKQRTIYLRIKSMPGLLDEGEWEWYIKNEGFEECTCQINAFLTAQPKIAIENIPHVHAYTL